MNYFYETGLSRVLVPPTGAQARVSIWSPNREGTPQNHTPYPRKTSAVLQILAPFYVNNFFFHPNETGGGLSPGRSPIPDASANRTGAGAGRVFGRGEWEWFAGDVCVEHTKD